MLIRQITERESLRRTEMPDGTKQATWRLEGTTAKILFVRVSSDSSPAYLWPDKPMPAAPPGTVSFGEDGPDIAEARRRLPEHEALWDAVRHELWTAISEYGPKLGRTVTR
jgi:hypothetical protein